MFKLSACCGVLGREFAVSHDKRLYGTLVDCYESIMQTSREALLSLKKGGLSMYAFMRLTSRCMTHSSLNVAMCSSNCCWNFSGPSVICVNCSFSAARSLSIVLCEASISSIREDN